MKKLPELGPPDENPGDIGFDDPEVEAAFLASVGERLRQLKARLQIQHYDEPEESSGKNGKAR